MFLTSDETAHLPDFGEGAPARSGLALRARRGLGPLDILERPDVFNRGVGAFLKGYRP